MLYHEHEASVRTQASQSLAAAQLLTSLGIALVGRVVGSVTPFASHNSGASHTHASPVAQFGDFALRLFEVRVGGLR
jgi:uncharacterized Ntn-hydrolase superfamily protein